MAKTGVHWAPRTIQCIMGGIIWSKSSCPFRTENYWGILLLFISLCPFERALITLCKLSVLPKRLVSKHTFPEEISAAFLLAGCRLWILCPTVSLTFILENLQYLPIKLFHFLPYGFPNLPPGTCSFWHPLQIMHKQLCIQMALWP